ncbi:uncharacterized protein LOC126818931 [Patella vulgata]|uniref:uncharacterized protein LOC126818931 n=1 Tax=Patella vulgata TaxID=6465 RepID=UPI00217FF181|nr:uncharacterized protein LOC126818931 [Patella vulgata]
MDHFLRIIFWIQTFTLVVASLGSQCTFPTDWRGTWYQSMLGDIEISLHNMSRMGHCVEKEDNKYLLFDRSQLCFRCLVFTPRHKNILQYKAGYCYKQNSLRDVCGHITGDDPLLTIVKVHSEPVQCPFQGPYLFSYTNESNTECAEPMSEIQACADSSRFKFKFRHCHHRPETHNLNLNFQCYATWHNGERFLYGKFTSRSMVSREQMYRCFMFSFWGTRGEMSMSADASCLGLQSPSVGGMTMVLHHRGDSWPQPACSFPSFFTKIREWRDLAGKYRIIVDKDRETFRLLDAADPIYGHDVQTETRLSIRCIDIPTNMAGKEIMNILTYTTNDTCVSEYQCVRVVRHSHSVVELMFGTTQVDQFTKCHDHHFRQSVKHVLIPHGSRPSPCPFPGSYAYVDKMSDCGGRISIGCGNDAQMIVESSCPSGHQSVEILQCYYNWTVRESMFTIAGRPGDLRQTDCLVLKKSTEGFLIQAEEECGGGKLRIMNKSINYIITSPAEQCQVEEIVYKSTESTEGAVVKSTLIKSIQTRKDNRKIINNVAAVRWSWSLSLTLILTLMFLNR